MTKTSYAKESDKIVTWLEDVILQYKKITKKKRQDQKLLQNFFVSRISYDYTARLHSILYTYTKEIFKKVNKK